MPRDTGIPLDVLAKEHMSERRSNISARTAPLIILGYPDNVRGRFAHIVERCIVALPRAGQILLAKRVSLWETAHLMWKSFCHGNSVDHLRVVNHFLPALGAKRGVG